LFQREKRLHGYNRQLLRFPALNNPGKQIYLCNKTIPR